MKYLWSPHPREVRIWVSTVFLLISFKDRNCEICQRNKFTRAPCRRRNGGAVPDAEHFGDLITADHKVLSENCESRNIIDMQSWCRTWPPNGSSRLRAKQKLLSKHKRARKSSWSRNVSLKSFTLTILWNLARPVKIFPGIIVRRHHTSKLHCHKSRSVVTFCMVHQKFEDVFSVTSQDDEAAFGEMDAQGKVFVDLLELADALRVMGESERDVLQLLKELVAPLPDVLQQLQIGFGAPRQHGVPVQYGASVQYGAPQKLRGTGTHDDRDRCRHESRRNPRRTATTADQLRRSCTASRTSGHLLHSLWACRASSCRR